VAGRDFDFGKLCQGGALVHGEAFGLRQCDQLWADNASAMHTSCCRNLFHSAKKNPTATIYPLS